MAGVDARIGEALLRAGLIDQLQLRAAQAHQEKWGGRLARVLVDLGFAREDRLADTLATAFGVPRMKLATLPADRDALAKLDQAFCEQKNVFPCALRDGGKLLFVAVDDPTDLELLDGIGLRADVPRVKPVVAGFDEIQVAILRWYRGEALHQKQRQVAAGIELDDSDPGEAEITDPRGMVVLRMDSGAAAPAAPTTLRPPGSGLADAQAKLDDLLGSRASSLTPDDERRVAAIRDAQERGVRVLRAIVSLCSEKGFFGIDEYRARMRR